MCSSKSLYLVVPHANGNGVACFLCSATIWYTIEFINIQSGNPNCLNFQIMLHFLLFILGPKVSMVNHCYIIDKMDQNEKTINNNNPNITIKPINKDYQFLFLINIFFAIIRLSLFSESFEFILTRWLVFQQEFKL